MKHGSLFSGIGGFDLASERMGWENVFHCEIDEFCQRILNYYWPKAKSYDDIKKTDFTIWRGKLDIITGGFPCQPYSQAGLRKGKEDDRHLWPEMCRAIREIQPRWVVGENVSGLLNWNGGMVLDEIKADLEAAGFEVLPPLVLPACAVNAPHRRDRVWICARNKNGGGENSIDRFGGFSKGESGSLENLWERLHSNKNKSENNIAAPILNERSEGDGCGSHQSEPIGQPEREFEISSALYQYAQQEEAGWSPLAEGEEQMEGDNLCEQSENLVGSIRQGGIGEGSISESEGEIRIDNTEEINGPITYSKYTGQPKLATNNRRTGNEANNVTAHVISGDATNTQAGKSGQQETGNGREGIKRGGCDMPITPNPNSRRQPCKEYREKESRRLTETGIPGDWTNFPTQSPICSRDDGISGGLDGITFPKWRNESIKAYGNAIVPQVVYQIFKAIELMEVEMLNVQKCLINEENFISHILQIPCYEK